MLCPLASALPITASALTRRSLCRGRVLRHERHEARGRTSAGGAKLVSLGRGGENEANTTHEKKRRSSQSGGRSRENYRRPPTQETLRWSSSSVSTENHSRSTQDSARRRQPSRRQYSVQRRGVWGRRKGKARSGVSKQQRAAREGKYQRHCVNRLSVPGSTRYGSRVCETGW